MLTNKALDKYFESIAIEGETYFHYLYVRRMSSPLEGYKLGKGILLAEVSKVICFTNKRLLIVNIGPLGGFSSYDMKTVNMEEIESITIKQGFSGTTIKIDLNFDRGSVRLNPNSFVIGLSNHKENLKSLCKLYS
ncbi:PH domain-containing protein [Bacillus cereus]|uniref:PH domain-containing protein n=1 Tax=Bacillus cereus TaxID=1396 RepID=UPI003D180651